ncbi:MAG: helix-turn-helix domain-containing protein [Clostridia bacterium]|nr:helix-turn-helix domain-containing protein [Clostridia bacterium]
MSLVMDDGSRIFSLRIGDAELEAVIGRSGDPSEVNTSPHSHSFCELIFSVHGSFSVEISGGEMIKVSEGDACVIPPSTFHCCVLPSEGCVSYGIRFRLVGSPSGEDGGVRRAVIAMLAAVDRPFRLSAQPNLLEYLKLAIREAECAAPGSEIYCRSLLTCFILELTRLFIGANTTFGDNELAIDGGLAERAYLIDEFFYNNLGESITEEDLALAMNLSKRHVSRIVRRLYNKSFRQILIDCRLERAARLLIDTELSVSEISELVGYSSLSGFYSAFTKRFGCGCSEYRRSMRA